MRKRDRRIASATEQAWWEIRHGRWGLLLILTCHQAVVAVMLAVETWLFDYDGVRVPLLAVWPVVFFLGATGAFDVWRRRLPHRVDLAQALMLAAYGSRAMALGLSGVSAGWTTSKFVGLVTWAALMLACQRAWTEARSAL